MSSVLPSKSPCRILVVEDYPDMSEALATLLRAAGHAVAVAGDGNSALATARSLRPEIVVSDIGLPGGMDGYELARAFRADPELRGCYLVALTGHAYATDVEKARQAGFEEHLAKPAAVDVVLGLIERAQADIERRSSKPAATPPPPPSDASETRAGTTSTNV
jgi:CheY-like chemotaxis protein